MTRHGLLILFYRLGWETRVPLVLREFFDVVNVGFDIFKNFDRVNFEFLEIHRCPEGAKTGFSSLLLNLETLSWNFEWWTIKYENCGIKIRFFHILWKISKKLLKMAQNA